MPLAQGLISNRRASRVSCASNDKYGIGTPTSRYSCFLAYENQQHQLLRIQFQNIFYLRRAV